MVGLDLESLGSPIFTRGYYDVPLGFVRCVFVQIRYGSFKGSVSMDLQGKA